MRRPDSMSILAVSLLLCSLAASAWSENLTTITLGFTGRLSEPITQSALQGAQLAVDDANAMAIRRRSPLRLQLLPQDDHGNENFAINIARYYIKENVAGVVGPWSSDAALATAAIYENAGIPQIGFTATSSQWTSMGHRMPFRVVGGTQELSAALAEVASRSLAGKRVFVIQNDSAYSNALADAVMERLAATAPGIALGRIQVARRTTDFHVAMQAAIQHDADVIVFLALYPQARAFIDAARRSGSKARILLTGGASNLQLASQPEPRLHVLEFEIARDYCPQWKKVAQAYRSKFDAAPTTYSFYAYDAASVLGAAILQTGSGDGRRIAVALHQLRHPGLHGPISFAPNGARANPRYTLFRHDGRWQPMEFFPAGSGRHEPCV